MMFWVATVLTLLAFAAPAIWGGLDDRLAVAALFIGSLLTIVVDSLTIGTSRWGVALVDIVVLASLVGLALRRRRWWLIAASSLQLAFVMTHAVAFLRSDFLIWTAVSVRLATWGFVVLTLFFGAYEAYIVRRYRLEEANTHA